MYLIVKEVEVGWTVQDWNGWQEWATRGQGIENFRIVEMGDGWEADVNECSKLKIT